MEGFDTQVDWVHKFGYNPDVDQLTDPEDVWSAGGLYTFPAAAGTLSIASASVEDDADEDPAKTGAFTIRVVGIDADGYEQREDFTLNGQTAVESTSTWLRVHRAWVLTCGSAGTNVGAITITHSDGPSTVAEIPALAEAVGQTEMAIYTVPLDYARAYIRYLHAGMARLVTGAEAVVRIDVRPSGGAWLTKQVVTISSSAPAHEEFPGRSFSVAPGSDIRVRVVETSDNDVGVWAGFDLAQLRY